MRQLVPAYSFSRDGFRSGKCAAAMHGGERQAAAYKRKRTQAWLGKDGRMAVDANAKSGATGTPKAEVRTPVQVG